MDGSQAAQTRRCRRQRVTLKKKRFPRTCEDVRTSRGAESPAEVVRAEHTDSSPPSTAATRECAVGTEQGRTRLAVGWPRVNHVPSLPPSSDPPIFFYLRFALRGDRSSVTHFLKQKRKKVSFFFQLYLISLPSS